MRIAQLTKEYSPNGGVGRYVTALSRVLDAVGHEVAIVHADRNAEFGSSSNIQENYVEAFDAFGGESCKSRVVEVIQILDSFQPDVVLIQGNNNFPLEVEIRRRFAAIKFLHVYDFCPSGNKFHHASQQTCHHPTGPMCLARMVYKRCLMTKRPGVILRHYRRCVEANRNNAEFDRLIVASDHMKEQAVASGYAPSQIEVLPYFTELPPASPPGDGHTILFLGRIEREKGVDRLFEAVSRMRTQWRLVIAGDGTDLERAQRRARRLGLSGRVEFLGWVSGESRSKLFRQASVVAVPSVWPEPFGIVGIEAMSHGRPVVAFRVGGVPEWLEHEVSGFIVKPYDVDELAGRLTYLLDQPLLAQAMGARGREAAESRFGRDRHIARLIGILRNTIETRVCTATCAG